MSQFDRESHPAGLREVTVSFDIIFSADVFVDPGELQTRVWDIFVSTYLSVDFPARLVLLAFSCE